MARKTAVVTGQTYTDATLDITDYGFGAVDGAILLFVNGSLQSTDNVHATGCMVLWDGTNLVSASWCDKDAVDPTVCSTGLRDTVTFLDGTTATAVGTISAITDGIRITWSDAPNSSWRFRGVFLGGGVPVAVGSLRMSTSIGGSADYTGASFQPTAGIFLGGLATTFPAISTHATTAIGAFTYKDSTITQRCAQYGSKSAVGTSEITGNARNDRVFAYAQTTASWQAEITAVLSNGFTLTTRNNATSAPYLGFMLFGDTGNVALNDTPLPSATGSKSWEGPGFNPELVMMVQSGMDAYNTVYTGEDENLTIGFMSSAHESSFCFFAEDAATVANTGHIISADILGGYATDYADAYYADRSSFDSLGYNLNYTTLNGAAPGDIGFSLALILSPVAPSANPLFMGAGV